METYQKVATYDAKKGEVKKIILLYSGSLASTILIPWLKKNYKAEIVTLLINLGQRDDFEQLNKKAKKYGAIKTITLDAQDTFIQEYITRAIKANATYEHSYHLADPMSKALCAQLAVEVAKDEGAGAIAHACAPQSSDQLRLDGTILTMNPDMKIIAPFRDGRLSYFDLEKIAQAYHIEHTPLNQLYAYDENLWGNVLLGGDVEGEVRRESLAPFLQVTKDATQAASIPEKITLTFEQGIPTALNGKVLPLKEIIAQLTTFGGKHAIGVTYSIKDNIFGLKARAINEEPAAEILIFAHKTLEGYVCTAAENEFKPFIDDKWTRLCYAGKWFEPLLQDCNAYIDNVNQKVSGTVTLQLYKGKIELITIQTKKKIFEQKLAVLMGSGVINQRATTGYIEIATLPMQLAHQDRKNILLTIGKRNNKMKLITLLKNLDKNQFSLYATYKTHKFLQKNGISSILVHKISQKNLQPNMSDLLDRNRFDIVIRILTSKKPTASEKVAADLLTRKAKENHFQLISSLDEAQTVLESFLS